MTAKEAPYEGRWGFLEFPMVMMEVVGGTFDHRNFTTGP